MPLSHTGVTPTAGCALTCARPDAGVTATSAAQNAMRRTQRSRIMGIAYSRRADRASQTVDVVVLENPFRRAASDDREHRAADLLGRRDVLRRQPFEQREERAEDRIGGIDPRGLRSDAVQGPDGARPEYVHALEREREQRILRLPFDARPHHASALRAVRAGAGHE